MWTTEDLKDLVFANSTHPPFFSLQFFGVGGMKGTYQSSVHCFKKPINTTFSFLWDF